MKYKGKKRGKAKIHFSVSSDTENKKDKTHVPNEDHQTT